MAMNRYQLTPRANTPAINKDLAFKSMEYVKGVHRPAWGFPTMQTVGGKEWRGTNQPKTLRFSAKSDEHAVAILEFYGDDKAFVWNITEKHYA